MGHANLSNICQFFVRRLYAKGRLSVSECVSALKEAGETVHASEGLYEDEYMLAYATTWCVRFLTGCDGIQYRPPQIDAIVTPILETDRQREVYEEWLEEGDPDSEEDMKVLDGIQWKFAPGWRKKYSEIPMLGNVTN